MGSNKLSGAARAKFDNGVERRTDRRVIGEALEEMRTEEGLDRTEAMNNTALVRRQRILSGNNPDDPIKSLTLKELDAAVKTLGELTAEEREQYHNTAFNALEYEERSREASMLHAMDVDLADLVDTDAADDYYFHDMQDRMMI